ncbi:cell envelope integrity TolA family protein [Olegusella massiliensis]|uniref:hypothetical protein n=1 Tax=Olegusella massiliensis TaxID=1776381 RepID=UPI0016526FD7|nr:hypothetical protein [Olegusella massiliensis]
MSGRGLYARFFDGHPSEGAHASSHSTHLRYSASVRAFPDADRSTDANFHLHLFSQRLTKDGRLAVGETYNKASRKSALHKVFVREMRARGWDMEPHKTRQEKVNDGTYEKKQSGRSANEYARTERAKREARAEEQRLTAKAQEVEAKNTEVEAVKTDADEYAMKTKTAAKTHAETIVSDAQTEAATVTATARQTAADVTREAEASRAAMLVKAQCEADADTAAVEASEMTRAAKEYADAIGFNGVNADTKAVPRAVSIAIVGVVAEVWPRYGRPAQRLSATSHATISSRASCRASVARGWRSVAASETHRGHAMLRPVSIVQATVSRASENAERIHGTPRGGLGYPGE